MARTKTIRDIAVAGRRVFVRCDFNVPLDGDRITDDTRIAGAVPTLSYLAEAGARVIVASHLGRPKKGPEARFSLAPVVADLRAKLGRPVKFVTDCIGPEVEAAVAALEDGEILLLENVRFHPGEEKNDPQLSRTFASYADIFVNDAFGTAHRAHASTAGIAEFIEGPKVCGLLIEKELAFLGDKTAHPERPFVVILGGAKVSDKMPVIDRLLEKANTILIGGAMAYTFALATGGKVGGSLCEPDKVDMAREALAKAKERGVKFLTPVDTLITDKFDFKAGTVGQTRIVEGDIPDGWEGVDIGPATTALFATEIAGAKTVLWNGPMGVFEIEVCAQGTFAIAHAVAANQDATTIIGGGDSVTAINAAGVGHQVSFISTGGGASLEFLEGKPLPGVEVLDRT